MNMPSLHSEEPAQPAPHYGWFETILRSCVAITMLAMMVVTTLDVIGRYVFSSPLSGSYELIQVLVGLTVFTALPLTTLSGAHVNISMLDSFFRGRAIKVRRVVILALGGAIVGGIAYQLWELGQQMIRSGQVLGILEIPLGLVAFSFSAFAMLTVIVHGMLIVREVQTPVPHPGQREMQTEIAR